MLPRRVIAAIAVVALVVPIVASAVVAIVGLANDETPEPAELSSSAPTFATLDDLVAATDLVVAAVVAEVTDGRTLTAPDRPDAGVRTRLVELEVTRTLAGEAPEPLVVEEASALLDGTPVVVDGMVPLQAGDAAIWFLVAGGSDELPYHAVVNAQGRFQIVADSLEPAGDDPLSRQLAALGPDGLIAEVVARS